MVSWADAKQKTTGNRKEIERLKFVQNGDTKIRLIGEVYPRYIYWVTTSEGDRRPVECLRFDKQTQEFNDSKKDPVQEIPVEATNGEKLKPQFAYVCNAIDRADGKVKLVDLKITIYKQIVEFAKNPDFGDPSDPKTGYDLTIKHEKTGPARQNVKYTVMPGRNNTPLSDEEKELETYDLDSIMKVPTYEEQKDWLLKNTHYFAEDESEFSTDETAEDL